MQSDGLPAVQRYLPQSQGAHNLIINHAHFGKLVGLKKRLPLRLPMCQQYRMGCLLLATQVRYAVKWESVGRRNPCVTNELNPFANSRFAPPSLRGLKFGQISLANFEVSLHYCP